MRNRITLIVGALLLVLLVPLLVPSSAAAKGDTSWGRSPVCDIGSWFCGSITHYSPDYGVDGPFLIRCRFGDSTSNRWVYEGQKSTSVCPAGEGGVDQVYVYSNRKIVCRSIYGWIDQFTTPGWNKIYDGQHPVCVHQALDEAES